MATFIVSADRRAVEGAEVRPVDIDLFTWARLALQTHHADQVVRRWTSFGRVTCPHHFTVEPWAFPHGCRTRTLALRSFLELASQAQKDAAARAGYITQYEAECGICDATTSRRHERRTRRRNANRPEHAPQQPIPYPLERVDIG